MARIAFRNFTGGEVTPTLSARYDLQKFGTFLQCCQNFIPNLHGDIERRPGTRFVAELGAASVLIPFQFNSDRAENFALIFQAGKILVASEDGLLDGVNLDSPYKLEDVYQLSVAQVGDIVYLAHRDYPLRKLIRSGAYPFTWTLATVPLNQSLAAPSTPVVTWHRGPKNSDSSESFTKNENYTLNYVVTALDANGVESVPSQVGGVKGRYPTDWVQGDFVRLTWNSVPGATEYNIYRESAGYYGFVGVATNDRIQDGTVASLTVGGMTAPRVGYSARVYHRFYDRGTIWQDPVEEVGQLAVVADEGQNAFMVDGRLFVYVAKVTERYHENCVTDEEGKEECTWVLTSSSTEYFWAMVTPASADSPAGTYASYTKGDAGQNKEYPFGSIGPYTINVVNYEGSATLTFEDQNFEPDTAQTPKENWDPFADGNNPATVSFHEQRLVVGGTRAQPATFYMSRTGDYESFRKSRPLQDDDPVDYMLASGSVDEIKWVASFGGLLIGSSGAEYEASSSGAAITPKDVQISTESYWGSAGLPPLIIGSSILHCQRSGSHVRDLAYSWEQDGYSGTDLSLLAPQLVEGHSIRQWAYQQSPGSVVWMVREDGVMLALTYMREQNVFGWSRHVTDGRVLSLCALSGDGEDVIMLVVERGGRFFLERMAGRFTDADGIEQAFFVDCGKTVVMEEAGAVVSGFDHLEGREVAVLADGSPEMGHVVQGGKIELMYPAKTVTAGLNYSSVLVPLPVEADADGGSTLGRRRGYGKCVLRLYRSVGGSYAATRDGDLYDVDAWQGREFYDLPFVPDDFGMAVPPFSGNIEVSLPSGQDADTSIILKQDRPMPFRVIAITADVDVAEQ